MLFAVLIGGRQIEQLGRAGMSPAPASTAAQVRNPHSHTCAGERRCRPSPPTSRI